MEEKQAAERQRSEMKKNEFINWDSEKVLQAVEDGRWKVGVEAAWLGLNHSGDVDAPLGMVQ